MGKTLRPKSMNVPLWHKKGNPQKILLHFNQNYLALNFKCGNIDSVSSQFQPEVNNTKRVQWLIQTSYIIINNQTGIRDYLSMDPINYDNQITNIVAILVVFSDMNIVFQLYESCGQQIMLFQCTQWDFVDSWLITAYVLYWS